MASWTAPLKAGTSAQNHWENAAADTPVWHRVANAHIRGLDDIRALGGEGE
jgi:hypothetical protein